MIEEIRQLLEIVSPHVTDRTTISRLIEIANDQKRWSEAHGLFSAIRKKSLKAIEVRDYRAATQLGFEEICAKAIYNEAHTDMPFDSDSPFWVVPFALQLASELGIDHSQILRVVIKTSPEGWRR